MPHNLDESNGLASAHVLWTICSCVWQAMSVMLEGFGRRIPGDAGGQSTQFRFLMQSNNELRAQLATCRRDYLRELTELRERCRRIEPCAEEALMELLREEPGRSHCSSPVKRNKTTNQTLFDEHSVLSKSGLSHSNSPEKKNRTVNPNSFGEQSVLFKSGLSQSSSPEKRRRRGAGGCPQLDPLEYVPKPITSLCEMSCGQHAATDDGTFLLGRGTSASAFLPCSSPPLRQGLKSSGSNPSLTYASNCVTGTSVAAGWSETLQPGWQEEERSKHSMRKCGSLPTLPR